MVLHGLLTTTQSRPYMPALLGSLSTQASNITNPGARRKILALVNSFESCFESDWQRSPALKWSSNPEENQKKLQYLQVLIGSNSTPGCSEVDRARHIFDCCNSISESVHGIEVAGLIEVNPHSAFTLSPEELVLYQLFDAGIAGQEKAKSLQQRQSYFNKLSEHCRKTTNSSEAIEVRGQSAMTNLISVLGEEAYRSITQQLGAAELNSSGAHRVAYLLSLFIRSEEPDLDKRFDQVVQEFNDLAS